MMPQCGLCKIQLVRPLGLRWTVAGIICNDQYGSITGLMADDSGSKNCEGWGIWWIVTSTATGVDNFETLLT